MVAVRRPRRAARWRDGAELDAHEEMSALTLAIVGETLFAADVEGEAARDRRARSTDALDSLQASCSRSPTLLERLPLPLDAPARAGARDGSTRRSTG